MKKRIGIVGFGEMGKRHGLEFREATQGLIELAGVVDPNDAMYERGCEWNDLRVPRFDSVGEMLEKTDLDGALIASPNHTHLENLRQFKNQTFPLLIEKPLETSLETVSDMVRFAADYPGKIMVDHVMRYSPIIRRARRMIKEGKLGRLASFQFTHREDCNPFHNFRRTKRTGGGQIIEKATHDLDVMLFLFDSLPTNVAMIARQQHCGGDKSDALQCSQCDERLTCSSSCHRNREHRLGLKDIDRSNDLCVYAEEVDVTDNETCLIALANGTFGTYSQSYFCRMPGHSRIYEIIGVEGAMTITLSAEDPRYHGLLKFFPRGHDGEIEVFDFEYFSRIHYNGGPYVARHFLDLMTHPDATPFTTVEQAFVAEALGFAAMTAAEEERFISVANVIPEDLKRVYASTYRQYI